MCSRTFATLEIPTASLAWYLPIILYLKGLVGVFVYDFDKCAWGKRPWDWVPNEGDVRVKAPTRIITNDPRMCAICSSCADAVTHEHRQRDVDKQVRLDVQGTLSLARLRASAARTAWLNRDSPLEVKLPELSLEQLKENLLLDPKKGGMARTALRDAL